MKGVNDYLFRAIDDAIERVGVLIALRKAPETLTPSRFDFNTTIVVVIWCPHYSREKKQTTKSPITVWHSHPRSFCNSQ